MFPELFRIGTFPVRTFGLALILVVVVAVMIARRRAPKFGVDPQRQWDIAFLLLVFGVLGSRALYIAQEWEYYSQHTSEIWSPQMDGLTSFGGIIAGLMVMTVWCWRTKTPFLSMMDVWAIPFLAGSAIGRVGCLLNGCCYGGPTSLPWGVHFHDLTGLHHPAQIYDSLMLLGGIFLVLWVEKRPLRPGQSMSMMFFFFGLSRFIYEFWRAGASSTYWGSLPITQAQAAAGLLALAGLVMFVVFGRKSPAMEVSTA